MADALALIRAYNADRDPERLALKYARMAADAFAFLRGSCHLFYAQLPPEALGAAPHAWACGDLHLENCGSYRGDNRQVYFDINDFDEAILAPASWDLVRVLASVLVSRSKLGVTRKGARELCRVLYAAYTGALVEGTARWLERETAVPPVERLLSRVRLRKARALLDARTVGRGKRRRLCVDGGKALPASEAEQEAVRDFFHGLAAHAPEPRAFTVRDVARRIAGTGSLGVERYVVLVRGKGDDHDAGWLLDLKAALPSAAARAGVLPTRQPLFADDAERIVRVQRRMQAIPMAMLHAVQLGGRPFVLRRLLPSEDRVSLAAVRARPDLAARLVADIGRCLAWDQLRSAGRQGSAP